MSFPFNTPSNLELACRLKNNVNIIRARSWTTYVNSVSKVAQVPNAKVEKALKAKNLQRYDRKFFLMQGRLTESHDIKPIIQGNYGYFWDISTHTLYLMIPVDSILFESVKDEEAIPKIVAMITQKNDASREATWEEMDAILEAFYGDDDESPEIPEFMSREKSISYRMDGKFRSAAHAPSVYAFKRGIRNSFAAQLAVEKMYRNYNHTGLSPHDQDKAKVLLNVSWFSRTKENFSWSPLVDMISAPPGEVVLDATPNLSKNNQMASIVYYIVEELNKENADTAQIKDQLLSLQDILKDLGERRNVFIDLFVALAGVISAPIALLLGLIWFIPSYCLSLPYFGKPEFLMDALTWFVDSLMTAVRCLFFPIEMIHAYNTSGSMEICKGECSRIIETLIARLDELEPVKAGSLQIEQASLKTY